MSIYGPNSFHVQVLSKYGMAIAPYLMLQHVEFSCRPYTQFRDNDRVIISVYEDDSHHLQFAYEEFALKETPPE